MAAILAVRRRTLPRAGVAALGLLVVACLLAGLIARHRLHRAPAAPTVPPPTRLAERVDAGGQVTFRVADPGSSVAITAPGLHGNAVVQADGEVTYVPYPGFHGWDVITVQTGIGSGDSVAFGVRLDVG